MVGRSWVIAMVGVLFWSTQMFGQFASADASVMNLPSSQETRQSLYLTGKVAGEGGVAIPDSVALKADCGGDVRVLGYADSHGNFGIAFSPDDSNPAASPLSPDTDSVNLAEVATCDLRADAPGFTTPKIPMARFVGDSGMVNVGTILLHPTVAAQGFTISAANANIPDKAKKQLEKGKKEAKKGKMASALAVFQKLASSYPRFALAWIELGRVQALQSQSTAARLSFHEALEVDDRLVTPYMGLADLDMREGNWQGLVDTSSRVLEFEPTSYPQFWFFNAIGNYNLHNFDKAEGSVLRGLALDPRHEMPKMEYLMGLILEVKHDYQGAARRFANYLKYSPHADDAGLARKQLADCQSAGDLMAKRNK